MASKPLCSTRGLLTFVLLLTAGSAGTQLALADPPAGQRCPPGGYVIGFDDESNIICSHVCGNGVIEGAEACDDGNRVDGDGCSSRCSREDGVALAPAAVVAPSQSPSAAAGPAPASTPTPATTPAPTSTPAPPVAVASAPELTVTDLEPYSVVYGKREHALTVVGTGFTSSTIVKFRGRSYTPSVNASGTELNVTLVTDGLTIGRYPITISNGADQEVTLKRAIAVY